MSNKTKWTPGPWLIAGESKTFVYALGPKGTNSFWADVMSAGSERIDPAERQANARLIAAAPELYEALEEMVMDWDNVLPEDRWPDFVGRARKALAKAKGEQ